MTEVNRVTLTEQELFDRLVELFTEQLVLADDISQLKKDAKFNKKTNPNGIAAEDLSFVAAAAKLEAKQNFEEFTGKAALVAAKYKELTKYDE
jgi:hypothetical protein